MKCFISIYGSISDRKESRMFRITNCQHNTPAEWSDEVRDAIELLTSKGFEVFHSPFVNVGGYIKNLEWEVNTYRRAEDQKRAEEKRKEEAREKRRANKEKREAAASGK